MNLFRSEETVKGWSQTAPGSEGGTLPVENWAAMFAADLFRKRATPDYLSRVPEYLAELMGLMMKLGMTGACFMPQ